MGLSQCLRLSLALLQRCRLGRSFSCWSRFILLAVLGLLVHKHTWSPGWLSGLALLSLYLSPSLGRFAGAGDALREGSVMSGQQHPVWGSENLSQLSLPSSLQALSSTAGWIP